MPRRSRFLRFSLLLWSAFCFPLVGFSDDLLQVYEQALSQDPRLKQALAQRNASQQAKPLAIAGLLPNVNVTAQSSTDSPAILDPNLFSPENTLIKDHSYTLSAVQPLVDVGSWFNLKQAQSIYNQADASYVNEEQELILRVAQAYFDVLLAEDNLTFVRAEKDAVEQQLRQTEEKFKVGLLAITDVNDFRARFDDSVASEISAQNEFDDAKERLRVITSEPVTLLSPLRRDLSLESPEPNDIEEWVSFAQTNNPLMTAARFNMEAKKSAVEVERSEHYPSLNVQGAYGQSRSGLVTNPGDTSDTGWALIFEAQMNLFAGGGIEANVNRAQYNYEDSRYIFEEVRRETISNARIAYRGVLAAIGQVSASNQALISAQSAYDANEASYEVGTKTAVDVLDSLSNLYDQQKNLAQAKYNYILDVLRLKKAAGTLGMADVRHVNAWLTAPSSIVQQKKTNPSSIETETTTAYEWAPPLTDDPSMVPTLPPTPTIEFFENVPVDSIADLEASPSAVAPAASPSSTETTSP